MLISQLAIYAAIVYDPMFFMTDVGVLRMI